MIEVTREIEISLTEANIPLLDQQLRKAFPASDFAGIVADKSVRIVVSDKTDAAVIEQMKALCAAHNPDDETDEQKAAREKLERQQAAETAAKEAAGKLDLASLAARIAYLEAKLGIQLEADVKG